MREKELSTLQHSTVMKLVNILSIATIIAAFASCSMEDDVLNELSQQTREEQKIEEQGAEAALSFKINTPTLLSTKGGTINDGDPKTQAIAETEAITHCSLILLEGNTILRAIDNLYVNNGILVYTKGQDDMVKLIVKVKENSNYRFVVVANSSTAFESTTFNYPNNTYNQITTSVQNKTDLDNLVKFGEKAIRFDDNFSGYASTKAALDNPIIIGTENGENGIVLHQLAARIELTEFTVTGLTEGTVPFDVTLTGVQLFNINTGSYTTTENTDYINNTYINSETVTFGENGRLIYQANSSDGSNGICLFNETEKPVFYTFRNQNTEKPVGMKIYFKVGNEERESRMIIVNPPKNNGYNGNHALDYVHSGYIYKLSVRFEVQNDMIDCSIKTYTEDWKYNCYFLDFNEK